MELSKRVATGEGRTPLLVARDLLRRYEGSRWEIENERLVSFDTAGNREISYSLKESIHFIEWIAEDRGDPIPVIAFKMLQEQNFEFLEGYRAMLRDLLKQICSVDDSNNSEP